VNEDDYLVDPRARFVGAPAAAAVISATIAHRQHTIAVADGLGGYAGGQRAAERAIDVVAALATAGAPPSTIREQSARLAASIEAAHDIVRREARADSTRSRMATTVTAVAFRDGAMIVAHVGHSRAYLFVEGVLRRITEDDTVSNALPWRTGSSGIGRKVPPWMHITLVSCVGGEVRPDVQVEIRPIRPGDIVMLCTDRLTDAVEEGVIARILAAAKSPRAACDALVDAAGSGKDDCTVLVVRVDG
jgi:protein phosphatase